MTEAVALIVKYQPWIFGGLGLMSLIYARALWRARRILSQTPFGLEREAALQKQNSAVAMLLVLAGLAVGVNLIREVVAPAVEQGGPGGEQVVAPTPMPTATPIVGVPGGGPLVVDSSGCENPEATLSEPQLETRISGSFEVRGTANITNFAFYKFEISGHATAGAWVPLHVGNTPVVDGPLGTFDSSAYESGAYAFRLVVLDSAGNSPPPCVVPVNIVSLRPADSP